MILLPNASGTTNSPPLTTVPGVAVAVNSPVTALRLRCGDREQRAVVDRFDESIPQRVERRAQCPDVFRHRDVLLRLRNDSAVVDDGAADNLIRSVVDGLYAGLP
jgi:hypothetical protein